MPKWFIICGMMHRSSLALIKNKSKINLILEKMKLKLLPFSSK
jgi:hypothetical protein